MNKDPLVFIKHIRDAITDIEHSVKNLSQNEFKENKDIKDATIRRIEIIGEATKNVPESFRTKHPEIPWSDIAGMRDKLIHEYFGVNLDRVWVVVKKDIPTLKRQIKEILEQK